MPNVIDQSVPVEHLNLAARNELDSEQREVICYGNFFGNDIGYTVNLSSYAIVTDADIVTGICYRTTFQNSRELLIKVDGVYEISWYMCCETTLPSKHITAGLSINSATTPATTGQNHIEMVTANAEFGLSGVGILRLAPGDTVAIIISTADAGVVATIHHIGLTVKRLGSRR